LKEAYQTIGRYKAELLETKQNLKQTLMKLSRAQSESTAATPVSVANENFGRKIQPHTSQMNVRKESFYRFNDPDEDSSSQLSVCDEEVFANYMGDYSLIKESGIDSLQMNIDNSFKNKYNKGEKSSSPTTNNNISIEEANYNSASNHIRNFDKYETKNKNKFMKEGSSGGLFVYEMGKRMVVNKPNFPDSIETSSYESEVSESVNCEIMSLATTSNPSQADLMLRHASISSLPVNKNSEVKRMPRSISLISLAGKQLPSKHERLLLNQYLCSIQEESHDNFKKYKKQIENKKSHQIEDVSVDDDEEESKKIPKSMNSASRYETNTSVESTDVVNMPNPTKSRNYEFIKPTMSGSFVNQTDRPYSRNMVDRTSSVFRTFEPNSGDFS